MYINPNESFPYVWFEPEEFEAGDEITIYYGEVGTLFYSDQLYIHCGFDGWSEEVETIGMNFNNEHNRWEFQLVIPENHEVFNFCFTDGQENWDNNSENDWSIVFQEIETPFVMDGQLDDSAELILSSDNQNLWISCIDNYLYFASNPPTNEEDVFILLSTELNSMVASPWSKSGEVLSWQYYLASEGTNNFCSWFNENEVIVSEENYAQAISGDFLEGYLSIENHFSFTDSLYISAAIYETSDNGLLLYQLPNGNSDQNIDPNEYFMYNFQNVDVDKFSIKPDDFRLVNHPNPFNPETTISYSIPEDSNVELSVYNIKGQKVRTLVKDKVDRGNHSIIWKGINDSEDSISSGVYFYKLAVDGKTKAVKKCLMLK